MIPVTVWEAQRQDGDACALPDARNRCLLPNMENVTKGLEPKGSLEYPEGTVITRAFQYARGGWRVKAKEKI